MHTDDATTPQCTICPRQLLDHEAGRYICLPCEHRIDRDLRAIAGPSGLYARLCLRIQPGRRGGDGPVVTRSASRSIPPDEDILSLTANGGIVSKLEAWVDDWAEHGYATRIHGGRLQYRVDKAVETLRFNLNRAASCHPAMKDFSTEIYKVRATAEAIINGERQPRQIPVQCPCGTVSKVTLNTDGFTCRACGTEYGHTEAFGLPMAARSAA